MPDCEYCEASFPDEQSYLEHLGADHYDDLGRIDRRRVDDATGGGDDGASNLTLYAIAGVGVLSLVALVGYLLVTGVLGDDELGEQGAAPNPPGFELGPPGEDEVYQPYEIGTTHYHGEITVEVDGERIDFRQPRFQHPRSSPAFHFEAGQAQWHGHAEGVTLEYALEATAFGITDKKFYFNGTHYDASEEGVTVSYEVNGESVDPETYVLQPDDEIRVVARSESSE
jgi:hypothetical protein